MLEEREREGYLGQAEINTKKEEIEGEIYSNE